MGLKKNFSDADIKKVIDEKIEAVILAILFRLQRIGEQFVTDARQNGSYTDRTGNLRSSIGYIVLRNGEQVALGGFQTVKLGGVGALIGEKVLHEAILSHATGLVLIVVAGMHYAAAVESKGYDVITGSGQIAVIALKKAIREIKRKAA